MTNYYTPTVVQPPIPFEAMTALEFLVLKNIFDHEVSDEIYFFTDDSPQDMIWLDKIELEQALNNSPEPKSRLKKFIVEKEPLFSPVEAEIEFDLSGFPHEFIFQDIIRRSTILTHISIISSFTCDKMRPDGFGGMVSLVTAKKIYGSSTHQLLQKFMKQAKLS
jgi:hypothetical protein